MQVIVSNGASDALSNVGDALNTGGLTGWDLVAAAVVVFLAYPVGRLAARFTGRAIGRVSGTSDEAVVDVGRVAKVLVYLIAGAIALSILNVNVGFLSILFALGLVLGALMLKPMVENTASGMLLLARPSFSVGDQIQTTDFRGTVEEIGSRSTVLRTDDGVVIHVSNNQVLSNPIVVYSAAESRKSRFDIGVPLDTDLDDVTSVLMTAVSSVDEVVADPAPQIQATAFVNDTITLRIGYWYPSTMTNDSAVTDAVIRATKSALAKADVELTAPEVRVTTTSAAPSSTAMSEDSDDDRTAEPAESG
ncbi:MAG: mechanosensitive ion channel [Acidimicrobiia bacterium]|nr:mechanosensitive ion channel [Acidimicrobiia bacterium]